MLLARQGLCQAIRRHHLSRNILNSHRIVGNLLPDEVVPNRDMLRPAVANEVVGQCLSAVIIRADSRWRICTVLQLLQEGVHPFHFLGDLRKRHVFRLHGG